MAVGILLAKIVDKVVTFRIVITRNLARTRTVDRLFLVRTLRLARVVQELDLVATERSSSSGQQWQQRQHMKQFSASHGGRRVGYEDLST